MSKESSKEMFFKPLKAAIVVGAFAVLAQAQQPANPPPQTQAAGSKPRIAIINTTVLYEKISEFKAKLEALNRRFEPRVKDLQSDADKINALETTLTSQAQVLTPARQAEMTEELARRKRDYQRKAEDLEDEGQRERDKELAPLNEKLSKFAQDYTTRRGITMMVDLPNAVSSGTVLWYDPRTDITEDFVNEYNKAHPMTTAPATPK